MQKVADIQTSSRGGVGCSQRANKARSEGSLTTSKYVILRQVMRGEWSLDLCMHSIRRVVSVICPAMRCVSHCIPGAASLQSNQTISPLPSSQLLLRLSSPPCQASLSLFQEHDGYLRNYNILRICCSPKYFSRPESRWSHHSYSMLSQMSLNHGVNLSDGSLNIVFRSSWET